MKRSSLRVFLSAVLMVVSLCVGAVERVADAAGAIYRRACDGLKSVFKLSEQKTTAKSNGIVGFVQAKAFVLRIAKRERPVIESQWRMCASI